MGWAYVYKAGPAGSLETLSNYCTFVRVPQEWSTGRRGQNPIVQHRHGTYPSPRKWVREANFILETGLRFTNPSGVVTHTDGAAGHAYENLGHLKRIFGGLQDSAVRLQRTAPDQGDVYLDVEQLGEALPSQSRNVFAWPLMAAHPFWIGAADTGNTAPTLTVAGDAPIGDAVVTLTGGTDTTLEHTASGASLQIEGAMPAGGVEIDCGAKTCVKVTGGADYSMHLAASKEWWLLLDPGANAVTVTGGGTASVDWYTQWR